MRITALIVSTIVLGTCFALAQDRQSSPKQITVLGSVELKEIADQANFTFSVKGVGSSLRFAVENANGRMKVVTDKLIRLGIAAHSISTSRFYSGENFADKAFLSSSRDYQATLTSFVKVDSLPLLESVLYTISESEVQNLSNIGFTLKDELDPRRRARIGAALKAKEKAEDIARALGVSLGKLLSIEETDPTRVFGQQSAQDYPNPFNPSATEIQFLRGGRTTDESMGAAFFAQTITVTSQVRAVFEIKESQ